MACALHVRATVHSFVIANKVHVAAVPGPSPNWAHPASANRAKSEASPLCRFIRPITARKSGKPVCQAMKTEKAKGESTPPAITSLSPARSGA